MAMRTGSNAERPAGDPVVSLEVPHHDCRPSRGTAPKARPTRQARRVTVVESQLAVAVPEQGNLVRVRDRYWVVESVRQSFLKSGDCGGFRWRRRGTQLEYYGRGSSFEVVHISTPTWVNELGAKGVEESGTIGAIPAVYNAVVDAVSQLGVRHRITPITPQQLCEAIAPGSCRQNIYKVD